MSKFTDHLWSDLAREYGATLALADRPEPARARLLRRPRVLAGGMLGLAGAGTALVLVLGAGSPAYAVTTNSNGSLLVTISQTSVLPQANAKLVAMGIAEQVTIYMAPGAASTSGPVTCTPAPGTLVPGPTLEVLVGSDGTEVVGSGPAAGNTAGNTGGNTGVGTYHLGSCVVTSNSGTSGTSGNTGNMGAG